MQAVDEERKYGKKEYIIYKKLNNQMIQEAKQDEKDIHYSIGIPSKNIDDYEIVKTFSSFSKMNTWLNSNYKKKIDKKDFKDAQKRDVFGDYLVKTNEKNAMQDSTHFSRHCLGNQSSFSTPPDKS